MDSELQKTRALTGLGLCMFKKKVSNSPNTLNSFAIFRFQIYSIYAYLLTLLKNFTLPSSLILMAFSGLLGCSADNLTMEGLIEIEPDWSLNDVRLDCQDNVPTAYCDGRVGLLLAITKGPFGNRFLSRCTAFHTQDDVIASDMHCLDEYTPEKSLYSSRPLDNYYYVMPNPGSNIPKIIKVKRFIAGRRDSSETNKTSMGVDVAYFQLEASLPDVGILPRDNSPAYNKQTLTAIVVNGASRAPNQTRHFEIDKFDCQVSSSLIFSPYPIGQNSAYLGLTDCPILPGNSGAPLINSHGGTQGIIWALFSLPDREVSTFIRKLNLFSTLLLEPGMIRPTDIAFATPFHCIPDVQQISKPESFTSCQIFQSPQQLTSPDVDFELLRNEIGQRFTELVISELESHLQNETERNQLRQLIESANGTDHFMIQITMPPGHKSGHEVYYSLTATPRTSDIMQSDSGSMQALVSTSIDQNGSVTVQVLKLNAFGRQIVTLGKDSEVPPLEPITTTAPVATPST